MNKTFALVVVLAFAVARPALAQISMQPTAAPAITAEMESWYLTNEPIIFAGNSYYPGGPSIHFMANEMVLSGFYRGVPLYTRTTIEPYSLVFVPVAGGMMRPYERRRSGDLVGTTGSSVPSLRVEIPTAFSASTTRLQAAGPPFAETQGIVTESPTPSFAPESTIGVDDRTAASDSNRVATGGALTPRRGKWVGPRAVNGIYVEFNNQRWYSTKPATVPDPTSLERIGEWHDFPVYTSRRTGSSTIYIPVAQGSEAYAAYSRK